MNIFLKKHTQRIVFRVLDKKKCFQNIPNTWWQVFEKKKNLVKNSQYSEYSVKYFGKKRMLKKYSDLIHRDFVWDNRRFSRFPQKHICRPISIGGLRPLPVTTPARHATSSLYSKIRVGSRGGLFQFYRNRPLTNERDFHCCRIGIIISSCYRAERLLECGIRRDNNIAVAVVFGQGRTRVARQWRRTSTRMCVRSIINVHFLGL